MINANIRMHSNFLTFLFLVSVGALIIFFRDVLWYAGGYIVFYTILVLILGFVKAEHASHKIAMLIGSIILPGIMPFIYYLTYIRKVIKKQQEIQSIKEQVLSEIRQSSQQTQSRQSPAQNNTGEQSPA